jgi:hypothetical protein
MFSRAVATAFSLVTSPAKELRGVFSQLTLGEVGVLGVREGYEPNGAIGARIESRQGHLQVANDA